MCRRALIKEGLVPAVKKKVSGASDAARVDVVTWSGADDCKFV